jgi:hypothetical protein
MSIGSTSERSFYSNRTIGYNIRLFLYIYLLLPVAVFGYSWCCLQGCWLSLHCFVGFESVVVADVSYLLGWSNVELLTRQCEAERVNSLHPRPAPALLASISMSITLCLLLFSGPGFHSVGDHRSIYWRDFREFSYRIC